ncbi:MAG: glycosyltransferase, partial [Bacteroidota bacterium]|nr:glycosyltransferase [Bacteroidota bacterium]
MPGEDSQAIYEAEEPLRAELFSSDQMEQHSKSLAKAHQISQKPITDRLLLRLADNEKVLLEVRNLLTDSVKGHFLLSPAGEWLLDNFYLIEEQIRTAKKHLPKKYSEGLPQLVSGPSAGLPRVYDIALEIISHTDGLIDIDILNNFLRAYQTVTHFQLGELWAVPIMLRLALIENLRRVSAQIAIDRINRNLAEYWTKRIIETSENDPKSLILVIADMARSNPPLERAFVAELTRQLRGKGPTLAQPLNWVEERLVEQGHTSNELVQAENQKQAADQVSVSNSIGSLRLLGSMDWRNFVETNSVVEQILRRDDLYGLMDFSTRDHYRHVVERIAKVSKLPEKDIAQFAIELTKENGKTNPSEDRTAHVGYYLVGNGLEQTEHRAKLKLPATDIVRRSLGRYSILVYSAAIFSITIGISAGIVYKAFFDDNDTWMVITVAILSLICTSQLAVTLVNFITTLIVRPSLLPRMDFSTGLPETSTCLVVVPTLLTSISDIEDLTEGLEVRFLANKDPHLHFALLTDFVDAAEENMPQDKPLLDLVKKRIEELNRKYDPGNNGSFMLFHRPRKWNPNDRIWMGYERKRGKLAELNGLLRGNSKGCFSEVIADATLFPKIKYIITLDTDTQLPREAAWKIVGSMAHPLNRAVFNEEKNRVTEGYGILQPRVSVSLPDLDSSIYARMNGNEPGIDPYTRATSDVYQDLFEEGSFIGKGIYDVDIFEKSMKGKFPENRILSHDLLEGCYARSGLLSDVQLYEKYPSRYDADMKRRHRWIRGDWQIAAWFTPFVPGGDKHWHKNPVSALSRFKIFDNIRRSLVPFAFTAFVILGWRFLHSAAFWTLIVTLIIILPVIVSSLWDLLRKPKDLILSHHLIISSKSVGSGAIRTLYTMICLPHEAFVSIDAILRTTWRMVISHKKLLEWAPSGHSTFKSDKSLLSSYVSMWVEPVIAIAVTVGLIITSPVTLQVAGPILLLWITAPFITWWVSKPISKQSAQLSGDANIYLRKLGRKTWHFFEKFVNENENWLPPDNFQETPMDLVANRTSPTNIGLTLLTNLAAHDFGYIAGGEFVERTAATFKTLQSMERYNGHFYNWYDTHSLKPLWPRYVSTVDSGNFAAHLLT